MEVAEKGWTTTDVNRLFRIPERIKSHKTIPALGCI